MPSGDLARFECWRKAGMAGEMLYMTDHLGDLHGDPRHLLPRARSIVCVGKLYNSAHPGGCEISSYAWGGDYHDVLRRDLERKN